MRNQTIKGSKHFSIIYFQLQQHESVFIKLPVLRELEGFLIQQFVPSERKTFVLTDVNVQSKNQEMGAVTIFLVKSHLSVL